MLQISGAGSRGVTPVISAQSTVEICVVV